MGGKCAAAWKPKDAVRDGVRVLVLQLGLLTR
jgi:hypothetical protein